MKKSLLFTLTLILTTPTWPAFAQQSIDALTSRGEALYNFPYSCVLCHGKDGKGFVGPSIQYGPTPHEIAYQLQTNPQMGSLRQVLKPTPEDLLALAIYIRKIAGQDLGDKTVQDLRATLAQIGKDDLQDPNFFLTERDELIQQVEKWDTVVKDWQRRAKTGSLKTAYQTRVVAEFDAGKPKFTPQPGKTYFYENTGIRNSPYRTEANRMTAKSSVVIVGDADTKQVISHYEFPHELRGAVHTTVMSPDARHVYIVGPKPPQTGGAAEIGPGSLFASASLIKVDALTLQPIKQIVNGGRLHHGQLFQNRYILMDTFARDADGLNVFMYDPETDEVLGGVRDTDLGGATYTAFTDDKFIYLLMEPTGYAHPAFGGFVAAAALQQSNYNVLRPFWIAKIDPETWEVVREYPYPGYRADWITFDADSKYMYVTKGGSNNLTKINIESGAVEWTSPVGTGPYGASLNADGTEVWVADKGETTGFYGRTVSVLDAVSGKQVTTLFSAFMVDHVLLAPNGREFWLTSNGEGRIYVFDAAKREQTHIIDMPGFGDVHGLVWVHYNQSGVPRVVADQGGFHGGINPKQGKPLAMSK